MFKLIKWALVFGLLFLGFAYYQKVSALSCMSSTLEQSVSSASSIFVGKVLSVDNEKANFEVSKYWKGNISSNQTIYGTTYWTGMPGGNIFFNIGQTYLVYTYKDQNGVERASIDCGRTVTNEERHVNEVVSILGNGTTYPITLPNPILPLYKPYCDKYALGRIKNNVYPGYKNDRESVHGLQEFLATYYDLGAKDGYALGESLNSGVFNSNVKKYVLKFQRETGVNPTGGVGPVTRAKMQSLCIPMVGGDRDAHGCIGSAGYTWCAVKNKCLRPFEESCGKVDESGGGPNCKVWYDGCNTCSRSTVGGMQACTMMACIQGGDAAWFAANKPMCREYFTNANEIPVIKSFTGPVQLNVGEKGTWKIDASVFNNQALTYNITWGDELLELAKMSSAPASFNSVVVQNTSFEHTYNRAGKFTVTIEVKAQNGQITKTTSTVNVQNLIVTTEPEKNGQCKVWTDNYGSECRRNYLNGPVADCVSWRARYFYNPNLKPVCTEYFSTTY
jgi:hypothetical protein